MTIGMTFGFSFVTMIALSVVVFGAFLSRRARNKYLIAQIINAEHPTSNNADNQINAKYNAWMTNILFGFLFSMSIILILSMLAML